MTTEGQADSQGSLSLPDAPGIEKGWEILTIEEDRTRGRFTANQLASNEARRASVVAMLAEGMSISAVARAHGMSRNTVLAAARRWGAEIERRKQSLGADCFDVARLAVERMRDEIDDMPKASLPIIAGVMIDKGQLLSGAPTARIEHSTSAPANFNDWLASVVDVTPQRVGQGEESMQRGISPEGTSQPQALPPAVPALAPSGDSQSPALSHSTEGSAPRAPNASQKESQP